MSERSSPLRPQVYLDDRPGGYFESLYEYAGAHRPDLIYDVARLVLTPFCMVAFRFRCVGCANVR